MADAAAFLARGKALSAKLPGKGGAEKPAKGLYGDCLDTPEPHGQNKTF